jgi:hypothetical protein
MTTAPEVNARICPEVVASGARELEFTGVRSIVCGCCSESTPNRELRRQTETPANHRVVDWGPVDRANRQGRRNAVGQSTEYDSFVKLKNQPLSEVNLSEGPSPQWRRWGWGQDGPLTLAVKATQ